MSHKSDILNAIETVKEEMSELQETLRHLNKLAKSKCITCRHFCPSETMTRCDRTGDAEYIKPKGKCRYHRV